MKQRKRNTLVWCVPKTLRRLSQIEFNWNITMEFNFESLFGARIVYPLVLFFFSFITILSIMSNGSLHLFSFVTVNTLQIDTLVCVTSSFPLLRLLFFGINTRHKCVMYLGFVHNAWASNFHLFHGFHESSWEWKQNKIWD